MGLGSNCPALKHGLRLAGFGAGGDQTQSTSDHFSCLIRFPGALEQAGHLQVFGGRLLGMTETFMNHVPDTNGR